MDLKDSQEDAGRYSKTRTERSRDGDHLKRDYSHNDNTYTDRLEKPSRKKTKSNKDDTEKLLRKY